MTVQRDESEAALSGLNWRPMTEADLDGVTAVADEAFPNHPEDRACFANRLGLYPGGCWVLADEDGAVAGYLVSHPWRLDEAPALNAPLPRLPEAPDVYYLHDLALASQARGGGHAARGAALAVQAAKDAGLALMTLTAVNEAAPFWARQGFQQRHSPAMAARLASYGADAVYMIRPV